MKVASLNVIASTVIALAVTACVTVLGINGTLDAAAVTGILGAVVGLAGANISAKIGGEISQNGNSRKG